MNKSAFILILPLTLFILSCGVEQNINTKNSAMAGSQAAPTEIIIFSDFQCPFCKKAARTVRRMVKTHPNRFKVYFKHFPLSYHQFAFRAACASEAARLQGKFWEMHDLLFAYSDELSEDTFIELAGKLDLNIEKFSKDINSGAVIEKVNADKAEGERLKISGTPYFFVNRQPFHGSYVDLQTEFN
jgi:protein-disulfide isomerase